MFVNCPPCKDCTERNAECHGKCEKYRLWAEENARLRNKRNMMKRTAYLSQETRPFKSKRK